MWSPTAVYVRELALVTGSWLQNVLGETYSGTIHREASNGYKTKGFVFLPETNI